MMRTMQDDPKILAEYARLEGLDELNSGRASFPLVSDVDWGAVHRLETVAPLWVTVPELPAAAVSKSMTEWRDGMLESHPPDGTSFRAYLFVYAEGDEMYEYDPYQLGSARYAWREPLIQLMPGVNAEVAAIYRAEDMTHRELSRVWARHHTVAVQVSRAFKREWHKDHSILVRRADPVQNGRL